MNILLVCACGYSTSVIAQSMKDNRKENEQDWSIEALSLPEAKNKFGKYDYLLLAPQVKYQGGMIRDMIKEYPDISVLDIPAIDFGRSNGAAVMDMIRKNEAQKA